jgi:hypothetical protein
MPEILVDDVPVQDSIPASITIAFFKAYYPHESFIFAYDAPPNTAIIRVPQPPSSISPISRTRMAIGNHNPDGTDGIGPRIKAWIQNVRSGIHRASVAVKNFLYGTSDE